MFVLQPFVTDGEDDLHDVTYLSGKLGDARRQVKCYGINIGRTNHIDKLCDET